MKHYYPNPYDQPGRRTLSHPIRSLLTTALLVYSGWAFRGCAEKPETIAYRLNRNVASNPVRHEKLLDKELETLLKIKGQAHRKHPAASGYVHPKDVRLEWEESQAGDYAVIELRNGHRYSLKQTGLQETLEAVSGLEQTTQGEAK